MKGDDPTAEAPLVCAECGREPRPGENDADEWRAYLHVDDDLPVFCPECAEREYGVDAPLGGSGAKD